MSISPTTRTLCLPTEVARTAVFCVAQQFESHRALCQMNRADAIGLIHAWSESHTEYAND